VNEAAFVLSGLAEGDVHLAAEGVSVDGGGGDGVGDLRCTLERGEDVRACVFGTRWISGQGGLVRCACRGSTSARRLRSYGLPREYKSYAMHEDAPAKASKTATTMNPVGSPPDGGAALPRAGEPVVPSAI